MNKVNKQSAPKDKNRVTGHTADIIAAEIKREAREIRYNARHLIKTTYNKALAKCNGSPTKAHYWVQRKKRSCIFQCKYCECYRAFNVTLGVLVSPFTARRFMNVFKPNELGKLKAMVRDVKRRGKQTMNRFQGGRVVAAN